MLHAHFNLTHHSRVEENHYRSKTISIQKEVRGKVFMF